MGEIRITVPSTKCERGRVEVLWMDISHFSKTTQFIVCCIAVFCIFLVYGYVQELIFTVEGFKPYGWYLTLVQFGFYTIFGYVESVFTSQKRKIPIKIYFLLAVLTLGTMGFSNSSLEYLNYPTQVIFKCCKLIPVLIGGVVIQNKKFSNMEFIAALSMCLGLIAFTLADVKVSPNFHAVGVLIISMALLCDAAIGNFQEKFIKKYSASNAEVVLYSYAIGFGYLVVLMSISGGLTSGYQFCSQNPVVYLYALLFSISGYLGVQVVLTLVKTCGAFVAVTVTTCRKAVTIVLSFVFFAKPFTFQYVWAGLLIILGIYLNLLNKSNPSLEAQLVNFVAKLIHRKGRHPSSIV
ncbi:hypothetical protein M8J76_001037 [Diaphorina citri]|nr:hypothetical protein M8J76_001037 [Diaphorina citri]